MADRTAGVPDTAEAAGADPHWWRHAVIYQIYPRSFADGNGDGLGDIDGIRARLSHVAELGVDAIWISPWYPSPMADAGYDVSDYRDIEPRFGDLAGAEALLREAHALGLRVILDIVPNHTSDRHRWFTEALAAGQGSPARRRYLFRTGRGEGGELPPNDWPSVFGGPAWTRLRDGEWYLHLFAPEQPDLDWTNPEVHAEFEQTLRFWFDRGVDGFRIDVAHGLAKAAGLPDLGLPRDADDGPGLLGTVRAREGEHPFWDRDEVHEVYRAWRTVADSYPDPRVFVAEAWVDRPERLIRYLRRDELHTAFNFDYLCAPWLADQLREVITTTVAAHAEVGAPPTWVLSNHDVARHVSRYARAQRPRPAHSLDDLHGMPADLALGERRARAATLLMLALPGGCYLYQGEELGLAEVEDLPEAVLDDPIWARSGHSQRGRDGCRVPLPWAGDEPPFGFSPAGAAAPPWLPQPAHWREYTVEAQLARPDSMLAFYREALRLRREIGTGTTLEWQPGPEGVLHFRRGRDFSCLSNVTAEPTPPPDGATILLASGALTPDGRVPADTTVWLRASTPA
jgi:alpha-glucosidase